MDGWPLGSDGLSDCSRFERGGADLDDSTSGGGADWRKFYVIKDCNAGLAVRAPAAAANQLALK